MYFKWCVVLDSFTLKVFTKQCNRKLFTGRYIIMQSQLQPRHSPVIKPLWKGR